MKMIIKASVLRKILLFALAAFMFLSSVNYLTLAEPDSSVTEAESSPRKFSVKPPIKELRYSSQEEMLAEMKLFAKNGNLELYVNESDMNIAVKNTADGSIFSSYPYDVDEGTGKYREENLHKFKSNFTVTYYDQQTTRHELYSYKDSVINGQFDIEPLDNGRGFELIMALGDDPQSDILPRVITDEAYEKILAMLDPDDRQLIESQMYFSRLTGTITSVTDAITAGVRSQGYEAVEINLIPDPTNERNAVTYRMRQPLPEAIRLRYEDIFKRAGYFREDADRDLAEAGVVIDEEVGALFSFRARFELESDRLRVTLPASSIEFDTELFKLDRIDFLQYFGAVTMEDYPDGYLFIPDGSGTIAAFNDDNPNRGSRITNRVYGRDASFMYEYPVSFSMNYYLPVFGVKAGNSAMMGIIEKSEGMAGIDTNMALAGVGLYYGTGPYFTYNIRDTAFVDRNTQGFETVVRSTITWDRYKYHEDDYVVSYHFLSGDEAGYVGMANKYREYLIGKGMTGENKNQLTFNMNTIGAATRPEVFIAFRYDKMQEFTRYEDNITIIKDLRSKGVENINLSLLGWQKSGLNYSVNNKFTTNKALGTDKDFDELADFCRDEGIGFYPSAEQFFVANMRSGNFKPKRDATRRLNGQYGTLRRLTLDTRRWSPAAFTITPGKYESYIESFVKSYGKTNANSVSFGLGGTFLNGDYKNKRTITRHEAQNIIESTLANVKNNNDIDLDFFGANAYVLPYAKRVSNIPLGSSGYAGQTYDIPFLQMVLNGSVNFSAPPANESTYIEEYLLKCIESQTSPTFNIAYDNIHLLRFTWFLEYYNVAYDAHGDTFIRHYNYIKDAAADVFSKRIVKHERPIDDIVYIQYEDGDEIYLNYASVDVTLENGITIKAKSYERR